MRAVQQSLGRSRSSAGVAVRAAAFACRAPALFALASLAFAAPAMVAPAQAAVWTDTRVWSPEWEQRYRDWVRETWDADSLHRPEDQLLFGLELDCADAVYTMRIVFAAANELPFAINDPRGRRAPITNRSADWDGLRQRLVIEDDATGAMRVETGPPLTDVEKLRRFIDDINDWTTTRNLSRDTYPIALSDIRPGDIYLTPGSHAYIVKDVSPTGAMTTVSASLPRAWRPMAVVEAFPAQAPSDRGRLDGYRRFKPIEHLATDAKKVPGASLEQWTVAATLGEDLAAFALATQESLADYRETPTDRIARRYAALCGYARERVAFVDEALAALERLAEEGRACMSMGAYADYSTPSRDQRLAGLFKLLGAEMAAEDWDLVGPGARRAVTTIFAPAEGRLSREEELGRCAIEIDYLNGTTITLSDLWSGLEAGFVSSDPHAPRPYRWGLIGPWEPACRVAQR